MHFTPGEKGRGIGLSHICSNKKLQDQNIITLGIWPCIRQDLQELRVVCVIVRLQVLQQEQLVSKHAVVQRWCSRATETKDGAAIADKIAKLATSQKYARAWQVLHS